MIIHPLAYIIVGVIVAITSAIVPGMIIFLIVGLIFIGIGVTKYILTKEDAPARHPSGKYIQCRKCGAWNYPHVVVCHHCGKNLQ